MRRYTVIISDTLMEGARARARQAIKDAVKAGAMAPGTVASDSDVIRAGLALLVTEVQHPVVAGALAST
jgi:hypothetical protein